MLTALRFLRGGAARLNHRIALGAVQVLGLPFWFTSLVVGIPVWFLAVALSHGRFDPGLATLVVVLTVQTSLDSGASNYSLRMTRAADEQRMTEIASLTVAIKAELDRSRERDEAAARADESAALRDGVLLQLINQLLDQLEKHEDSHD